MARSWRATGRSAPTRLPFRAIAMASAFSALVISAQLMRTSPTPGNEPTRSMMYAAQLGAQRTPGGGQRQRDDDDGTLGGATVGPVGTSSVRLNTMRGTRAASSPWAATTTSRGHAQLDDVGSQLGVDHMGEHGRHLVDRGLRKLRHRHGDDLLARTV